MARRRRSGAVSVRRPDRRAARQRPFTGGFHARTAPRTTRMPQSARRAPPAARPGGGPVVPGPGYGPALRRGACHRGPGWQEITGLGAGQGGTGAREPDGRTLAGRGGTGPGQRPAGGPACGRRDEGRSPAPGRRTWGATRGAARLAEPVRPGSGRNSGRCPAAAPDGAVDHRRSPRPDPAPRPATRVTTAPAGPPGAHLGARHGCAGDGRCRGVRAPGQGDGRPAGAIRGAPGCPAW